MLASISKGPGQEIRTVEGGAEVSQLILVEEVDRYCYEDLVLGVGVSIRIALLQLNLNLSFADKYKLQETNTINGTRPKVFGSDNIDQTSKDHRI